MRDISFEVKPGEIGQIAVARPDPVMFLEYWGNLEATRDKFIGDWMTTGDQGVIDDGPSFLCVALKKGQGFDKLSPNGIENQWPVRKSKHYPKRSRACRGSALGRRGAPCCT